MIRLVAGFLAAVIMARWVYSEVQMSFPFAVPYIDGALETVSIPTHDRWDKEKIKYAAQVVADRVQVTFRAVKAFRDEFKQPLPAPASRSARLRKQGSQSEV